MRSVPPQPANSPIARPMGAHCAWAVSPQRVPARIWSASDGGRLAADLAHRRAGRRPPASAQGLTAGAGRCGRGADRSDRRRDQCHAHAVSRSRSRPCPADRARASGRDPGRPWLGGLPIAVKDLNDVAGVRTTYGSPIYADHVPARSDLMVERLEERGAIVIGKSNTPEFGAGGNTFNEVFGETRNPWNTALTRGGSSGGSAAALAAGQVWLATGSDLGGSLRTPASFCSVVGLASQPRPRRQRPAGATLRHARGRGPHGTDRGRCRADARCHGRPSTRRTLSRSRRPAGSFRAAAAARRTPPRIAFSRGPGHVAGRSRGARDLLRRREPVRGAWARWSTRRVPTSAVRPKSFRTLRAVGYVADHLSLYETERDKLKPDVIWNIEHGLRLTTADIGRAELARGEIHRRVAEFFRTYDLLALSGRDRAAVRRRDSLDPRAGRGRLRQLRGAGCGSRVRSRSPSCPAISVPCGFTRDGRPVGLQLVGRPRGEAALLSAALAFEEMLGLAELVPIEPREPSSRWLDSFARDRRGRDALRGRLGGASTGPRSRRSCRPTDPGAVAAQLGRAAEAAIDRRGGRARRPSTTPDLDAEDRRAIGDDARDARPARFRRSGLTVAVDEPATDADDRPADEVLADEGLSALRLRTTAAYSAAAEAVDIDGSDDRPDRRARRASRRNPTPVSVAGLFLALDPSGGRSTATAARRARTGSRCRRQRRGLATRRFAGRPPTPAPSGSSRPMSSRGSGRSSPPGATSRSAGRSSRGTSGSTGPFSRAHRPSSSR